MTKIDIVPITGGFNLSAINQNFDDIAAELNDKVLYRDNPVGEPNQMLNDLDMNGNDILNLHALHVDQLIVNNVDLTNTAADAAAAEAAASAAAASAAQAQAIENTIQSFTGSLTNEGPFVSGVGFTPDVTTTLTLSKAYGIPANVQVHFDSEYQGTDQYSIVGNTIVFTSPIPSGVSKVYIVGGSTLAVSLDVPADGSVTDASIAVSSKLYKRINDVIDVKDFGAVGNGVTNDTSAFQSALNSAALTSGTVFVPPGTYVLNSITVPSGVTLKGWEGAKLIPIAGFGSGAALITIASGAVGSAVYGFTIDIPLSFSNSSGVYVNTNAQFCKVTDLHFPNGGGFAVNLVQTQNCRVERINILAANIMGISAQSGANNRIYDCYVTGVVGSHHMQLTSEIYSEITNCRSYLETGSGFGMNLNKCNFCTIRNCFTQDSSFEGINITDSTRCTITGCSVVYTGSQSQDFGISIEASTGAGSSLNMITNNIVHRSGKSGIAIAGSFVANAGNIIANNSIYSPGMLNLPNDGGILIYQGTGTATQNLVENNIIYGDGSHTKYGVLESSAYGGTPNANRISTNLVTNVTVANVSTVGSSTVSFIPSGW